MMTPMTKIKNRINKIGSLFGLGIFFAKAGVTFMGISLPEIFSTCWDSGRKIVLPPYANGILAYFSQIKHAVTIHFLAEYLWSDREDFTGWLCYSAKQFLYTVYFDFPEESIGIVIIMCRVTTINCPLIYNF